MKSGLEVEMKNNRRIAFATAVMLFAMSINIAAQSPQNDRAKGPAADHHDRRRRKTRRPVG